MIKKKKKAEGIETKLFNPSKLKGVEEIEIKPLEGMAKVEMKDMEGAKKVPKTSFGSTIAKPKSEDLMSIDLMLDSAKKKKPEANAVTAQDEEFKVEKTSSGKWENAAAKERYLKAIGKLKKK